MGACAIERSDVDPAVLLFEWLSEVVYWKDAAGVVFREAPLTLTREGEVWLLRAGLIGAPVNLSDARTPRRCESGHETSL